MRFAFISTMAGAPWGGSEELWSRTAQALARSGHSVWASVHHWEEPAPPVTAMREAGVTVQMRRPVFPTAGQHIWRKISKTSLGDLTHKAAVKWLSETQPDLVCISNGDTLSGAAWMQDCLNLGTRYATVSQSHYEFWWPSDEHAAQILPAFRAAKKCYFVSRRNRELFETQMGEPLPNSAIIRNPFNVRYDAEVAWPPIEPSLKLACVARLDPSSKGQDILLKVLAREKWQKRDLQVRFYGQGPCENNLRKLAETFRPGLVEFKGHVANVEEIWADNHALILTSRYEGLPLSIVEAMLCSRTVITTDVAGNAEFVEHDKNGFVALAPTVDLVDNALEEAWNKREQWQTMGMAARKHVVEMIPRDPVDAFCRELVSLVE